MVPSPDSNEPFGDCLLFFIVGQFLAYTQIYRWALMCPGRSTPTKLWQAVSNIQFKFLLARMKQQKREWQVFKQILLGLRPSDLELFQLRQRLDSTLYRCPMRRNLHFWLPLETPKHQRQLLLLLKVYHIGEFLNFLQRLFSVFFLICTIIRMVLVENWDLFRAPPPPPPPSTLCTPSYTARVITL